MAQAVNLMDESWKRYQADPQAEIERGNQAAVEVHPWLVGMSHDEIKAMRLEWMAAKAAKDSGLTLVPGVSLVVKMAALLDQFYGTQKAGAPADNSPK